MKNNVNAFFKNENEFKNAVENNYPVVPAYPFYEKPVPFGNLRGFPSGERSRGFLRNLNKNSA